MTSLICGILKKGTNEPIYRTEQRKKYHDITYMWNPKEQYKCTYLQNRNRVITVKIKLAVLKGGGGRDKLRLT